MYPIIDGVQLKLKSVNLAHTFYFKFGGRKSDSHSSIELSDRFFHDISKLYLNVSTEIFY
jgi:hypothetical protein